MLAPSNNGPSRLGRAEFVRIGRDDEFEPKVGFRMGISLKRGILRVD